jgi:hypothetical protein
MTQAPKTCGTLSIEKETQHQEGVLTGARAPVAGIFAGRELRGAEVFAVARVTERFAALAFPGRR